MSDSREEEEKIKELIQQRPNFKAIATEVTGPLDEFKQKVMKSAVAAAVNNALVSNDSRKVHAVVHAALEAAQSILIASLAYLSIKIKMSLVTDGKWIAVGMYGLASSHIAISHERTGLGIMHL